MPVGVKALPQIATGTRAIVAPLETSRRAYLPRELAELLGVDKSNIYRWIAKGLIRVDRTRGFTLIPVAEAKRFSREGTAPVT
jgi:excisionase family DNA binding protein